MSAGMCADGLRSRSRLRTQNHDGLFILQVLESLFCRFQVSVNIGSCICHVAFQRFSINCWDVM